ncbi:hypothetical protein sos41_27320 [Alphaproteobacteria bacterium SO-S41]|nr:hypothetical protein sos41_27320 [Alphaproteobacteria bacterium SO-S41]
MDTSIGRRIAGAALALGLLSGAAFAQFSPNERQSNAIENIAQVIAGANKCDDYALNERLVAAVQRFGGFSLTDAETYAYVEGRVLFHAKRIKDRTRDDICGAIERLYGVNGTAAPNLAVRVK